MKSILNLLMASLSKQKVYLVMKTAIVLSVVIAHSFVGGCAAKKTLNNKCGGQVCKIRVNVKDEMRSPKWSNFASPRTVRTNQAWPTYRLYQTKNGNADLVWTNSGTAYGSNGEMSWQTISNCLDWNELSNGNADKLNPKTGSENGDRKTFFVDGGASCPGQCLQYVMNFDKSNVRFTIDEGTCGINIDILCSPLRLRGTGAPLCFPCP